MWILRLRVHSPDDLSSVGKEFYNFHVRKQYSKSYFITINCVEFHSYILILFFKLDRMSVGQSPSKGSRMSNSR
jgi:hypothetical protein